MRRRQLLMLGAAVGLAPALAMTQQYPSRPVRLVNGFAVGGGVDYAVRLIAPALGDELKGTMVVENKVGASGMIAAQQVAKSPPDGYTLMITGGSAVMIAPQTVASPNFNPLADLVPINSVGGSPLGIAVHPSLGVRTLKDLITLSRTRQVTIASAGTGTMTHLTIELLIQAAPGGDIVHVPYKGGGAAVIDALAGHVNGMVSDIPPMYQHFQEGRLVPLAITSDKRFDILPNVPTANETVPGFSAVSWTCAFAPAKTPQAIIDKVSAAIVKVVAREDISAQLNKGGIIPGSKPTPEAFRKFVEEEYQRWGKLIREKNIVTG